MFSRRSSVATNGDSPTTATHEHARSPSAVSRKSSIGSHHSGLSKWSRATSVKGGTPTPSRSASVDLSGLDGPGGRDPWRGHPGHLSDEQQLKLAELKTTLTANGIHDEHGPAANAEGNGKGVIPEGTLLSVSLSLLPPCSRRAGLPARASTCLGQARLCVSQAESARALTHTAPTSPLCTSSRFLRARKFDVAGAAKQYEEFVRWRRDKGIDEKFEAYDVEQFGASPPVQGSAPPGRRPPALGHCARRELILWPSALARSLRTETLRAVYPMWTGRRDTVRPGAWWRAPL